MWVLLFLLSSFLSSSLASSLLSYLLLWPLWVLFFLLLSSFFLIFFFSFSSLLFTGAAHTAPKVLNTIKSYPLLLPYTPNQVLSFTHQNHKSPHTFIHCCQNFHSCQNVNHVVNQFLIFPYYVSNCIVYRKQKLNKIYKKL